MQYINRGASGYVLMGPLVTTSLAAKTGLTSDNSSFAFYYGSASGAWTDEYSLTESGVGYYWLGICSTPIGSLGHLRIHMQGTAALPHWEDVKVISTNVYQSFVTTVDYLQVDAMQIVGNGATVQGLNIGALNTDTAGLTTDALKVVMAYVGTTGASMSSAIMDASRDAFYTVNAYLGTTGASMTSGMMTTSRDAWNTLLKYVQSTGTTMTTYAGYNFNYFFTNANANTTHVVNQVSTEQTAIMSTASYVNVGAIASSTGMISTDALSVVVKYWGTTGGPLSTSNLSSGYISVETDLVAGTTLTGPLTTVSDLNIGAIAGTTVNTTVAQLGVNVVKIANATVSTMTGWNIEGFFYAGGASATSDVNDITTAPTMTMSTSTPITVGAFASAAITTRAGDNFATFFDAGAVSTRTVLEVSTFTTANKVDIGRLAGGTFSTRSADNIEAFFYNDGSTVPKDIGDLTTMTSANLSTFSTATPVDVGRFAGATFSTKSGDNIEGFFYNAGATVTKIVNSITTMTSANLSTLSTANKVDIGAVDGQVVSTAQPMMGVNVIQIASGAATANTLSTNTVYDVWTHGDLMKLLQSQLLGNTTYDGTTYVLYDHAGTTFVKFEVTTAERTRTT